MTAPDLHNPQTTKGAPASVTSVTSASAGQQPHTPHAGSAGPHTRTRAEEPTRMPVKTLPKLTLKGAPPAVAKPPAKPSKPTKPPGGAMQDAQDAAPGKVAAGPKVPKRRLPADWPSQKEWRRRLVLNIDLGREAARVLDVEVAELPAVLQLDEMTVLPIGIGAVLRAMATGKPGSTMRRRKINSLMAAFTQKVIYRQLVSLPGSRRSALDGGPGEEVTDEQRAQAVRWLQREAVAA